MRITTRTLQDVATTERSDARSARGWYGASIVLCALLAAGCGTKETAAEDTAGTTDTTTAGTDDASQVEDVAYDIQGYDAAEIDLSKIESKALGTVVKIKVMTDTFESALQGVFIHPLACSASKPCPLVIISGDYDPAPYPLWETPAKKLAATAGVNVVLFNMPGTGEGPQRSTGTNDYGDLWHKTTIQQLFKLKSVDPVVDKSQVGFLTFGTGIIPVAGAFYTFPADMKSTAFVIDVEGPMDRCSISQAPADPAKNVGPGDGAGATDGACHFSTAPQSAQYPASKDGKPASIVCAPGAWPITETGKGCDENGWWVDREPYAKLLKLTARYQRLQFKYDHRLPSYWASRLAMKAAANSQSNFFMLNDMPACSTLNESDCAALEGSGQSCWLSGPWGNGFGPAPYKGGDFQEISWDALFAEVLPDYVARVTDLKAFPKCK